MVFSGAFICDFYLCIYNLCVVGMYGMRFPLLLPHINAFHVTTFDYRVTFKLFTSLLLHCVRDAFHITAFDDIAYMKIIACTYEV